MSESRNAEIARRFESGASIVDLAREYGLSRQRISQIAHASGAERRRHGIPKLSIASPFGVVMREWRARRGWTQVDLARESGMAQNYVSMLEMGTREPTLRTIVRLAVSFGTTASELLTGYETACEQAEEWALTRRPRKRA
jgi:transcriptional regulator with XRE-family HTH domain